MTATAQLMFALLRLHFENVIEITALKAVVSKLDQIDPVDLVLEKEKARAEVAPLLNALQQSEPDSYLTILRKFDGTIQ